MFGISSGDGAGRRHCFPWLTLIVLLILFVEMSKSCCSVYAFPFVLSWEGHYAPPPHPSQSCCLCFLPWTLALQCTVAQQSKPLHFMFVQHPVDSPRTKQLRSTGDQMPVKDQVVCKIIGFMKIHEVQVIQHLKVANKKNIVLCFFFFFFKGS